MSALFLFFTQTALGRVLATAVLLTAAYLGLMWWGDSREAAGRAAERAEWQAAADIETARQEAARAAVESLGTKISADITNKIAGLEPILKDLADDAAKEPEPAPLPPGCPDVYRGIAPDSLRKLEGAR
jgi:hypothetical protein